jgi:hypothetical protein
MTRTSGRAFQERAKPFACPKCSKKGVSPYVQGSDGHAYRDCRYCGAHQTFDYQSKQWSYWRMPGETVAYPVNPLAMFLAKSCVAEKSA